MQEIFPGEVFANTVDFDKGIRQLLPRYDEMLEAITRCLSTTTRRVLELGCGTGELTLKIFQRFPHAQIMSVDYSPRMLEHACKKVTSAGYRQQWTGIQADFGEWAETPDKFDIGGEFDACVSSLAIHHLNDEMKLKLFQRIAASLNQGGYFCNADPILPESPLLKEVYQTVREEWAMEQGITLTQVRAKLGSSSQKGHSSQDQLATLDAHLQMLTISGFKIVVVPWKYYGLAVFAGWL
ncbi:class I SAM-dependent methyltransferase [Umezakia ovalisporum]|jgi:trans-aconitate 2-methyltransferase|uniref:Class I SAM-dependent methyltransferase n=2 Tax=Umezakia ovalisporum TaxID=75695 RepID=A0AA43KH06_9CYAN|nr:class I SAM-dependent methyltransferase [Umezakia ovalisporum]MBI1242103.1 methyltransferase domain-containing protein [Nostoc sp. RI_552]MDH6056714.1 class I SAM-dependent methyltransferase [Umezakia ovalisporum FSS-43]MDH6065682.1 class I SAM-dependent methyltransferase [Umezakia ovalisporum FSS-62]MDH6068670.1 class I SAM-dependent methyltransferase [Umezakia ovalisporum APH033B]MDH6070104.1 class I SAM-dependent methyltransferase [Umezakia ovalisporum CobakiLakeA]